MDEEPRERRINIQIDPESMAGVYANGVSVSFSDYEFTITFARVEHDVEGDEVPGIVVARVNVSHVFMGELVEALNESWSRWATREGIRNLPEQPKDS